MHWFTWLAISVLGTLAFGAIAFVLYYNRPLPRRRKWRDRDEHARIRFI
jgi:acyl-coenzyme A synthetase/AMP-(fatty) acid ligase